MTRKHEYRYADEVQHDGRDVHHVVGPIAPARQEAVELAENFLGPKIHAALSRIAMRQFDNGDTLGPEKHKERNNPEPNRDAAIRSNAGHHVQIEYRDNKERDKVPAAQ